MKSFLTILTLCLFYSSPYVEHCATIGYEAIDYFSTGNGFSKSQLGKKSVSSKKQGNVQNTEQLQPHIIVGGGEQRCIFDGSGLIGNAAAVEHFGQVAERPPSKRYEEHLMSRIVFGT